MKVPYRILLSSHRTLRVSARAGLTNVKYKPLTQTLRYRNTMAARDVTSQSNIHVMKTEVDGSFKRKASTFRNFIEKDGEFAPEKGLALTPLARV